MSKPLSEKKTALRQSDIRRALRLHGFNQSVKEDHTGLGVLHRARSSSPFSSLSSSPLRSGLSLCHPPHNPRDLLRDTESLPHARADHIHPLRQHSGALHARQRHHPGLVDADLLEVRVEAELGQEALPEGVPAHLGVIQRAVGATGLAGDGDFVVVQSVGREHSSLDVRVQLLLQLVDRVHVVPDLVVQLAVHDLLGCDLVAQLVDLGLQLALARLAGADQAHEIGHVRYGVVAVVCVHLLDGDLDETVQC
ncbi:hypothetical protein N7474_000978 [Penicillium riverlandense]|uniref:uncharacterized protein n=1 Tax=Penicillium riverlandense TaxID=1903569 RepID=UPI002549A392|nr:uncharacterized protein N7474_000978 [Penicillium riverlandense]KAJ5832667.1 hypothetical protein N7474_000978 [Penicillium riverlandense]